MESNKYKTYKDLETTKYKTNKDFETTMYKTYKDLEITKYKTKIWKLNTPCGKVKGCFHAVKAHWVYDVTPYFQDHRNMKV